MIAQGTSLTKVLAIDVGEKRVGLATCDELRMIASPFGFLERDGAIEKILEIIAAEEIGQLVVGLPQLSSGDLGTQAEDVKSFVSELESKTAIAIDYENEILSSVEAANRIKQSKKKMKHKGELDAMAACIILESYLGRIEK
jgi:putative Holliday junction resolvase